MSGRSRHHEHFRSSHRHGMSVSKIDETRFTKHEGNGSSAARTLQEALHLPRERTFLEKLFKPENLTVAGREVKGFVIPHWAAGVLLAAILGGMGYMYRSFSGEQQVQREMLIEMKTELRLAKEHELEYRNEFKTKLNVQQLQIEQLNLMKAILLPQNGKTQRKEN